MNKEEFIQKIRDKYPQYKGVDNDVLYNKVIEKYPTYKDQITESEIIKSEQNKKPKQASKNEFGWEPYTKTLLPMGGALVGALRGSIPGTAIGAGLGEVVSQGVSNIAHNRGGLDLNRVGQAALGAGLGQGLGVLGGKVFETIAPQVGKLAGINPDIYRYSMDVLKQGGKQVKNNWLIDGTFNRISPLKPSSLGDALETAGSGELLAELLLHAHPGIGAGSTLLAKKTLSTPYLHKLGLQGYGTLNRLKPGGMLGIEANNLVFPDTQSKKPTLINLRYNSEKSLS